VNQNNNLLLNSSIKLLLLLSLLFQSPLSVAQEIFEGRIIDHANGEGIPFVNIGLWGKDIGTVSNENGYFNLKIGNTNDNDTIRISCIGYKPQIFRFTEWKKHFQKNKTIVLFESATEIKPVVIRPKKTKIIGNKTKNQSIRAGFATNDLGSELALLVKIPGKPAQIDNFSFYVAQSLYDSLFFRLNIYTYQNGYPQENILHENIFVRSAIKNGRIIVDLLPYKLTTDTDVLISLEWIKDLSLQYGPKDGLFFAATLFGSPCFFRKTSQGKWHKVPVSLGFNATVTY